MNELRALNDSLLVMSKVSRAPMALGVSLDLPSEVGPGNGPETLLAGGIPNLEFDGLSFHTECFRSEFDSDGGVIVLFELFVGELQHQA